MQASVTADLAHGLTLTIAKKQRMSSTFGEITFVFWMLRQKQTILLLFYCEIASFTSAQVIFFTRVAARHIGVPALW